MVTNPRSRAGASEQEVWVSLCTNSKLTGHLAHIRKEPIMSLVTPVSSELATDKAVQTYERIREVLGVTEIPEIFQYMAAVPAFVHDFFMNFRKFVLSAGKLDEKRKLLIAFAVAGQAGSTKWLEYLQTFSAARNVTANEVTEALAVGATNSMYNVLFKFRDISGSDVFDGMGVGLRAHTFQGTSLDEKLENAIPWISHVK